MTEENNDPSSNKAFDSMGNDFRSVLEEFRENWQRELKEQKEQPGNKTVQKPTTEEAAEALYRKAVELEQKGKVYDALPLYRKALQLMPDIEFKYYENQKKKNIGDSSKAKLVTEKTKNDVNLPEEDNNNELIDDLCMKFREDLSNDEAYGNKFILSNRDPGVITTEKHISDLPPEIIMYILRWVVSSQLDMRSLEQCAAVCKGFYLIARDEKLWQLACRKVWGHNLGTLDDKEETCAKNEETEIVRHFTWRQMFLNRERLHFHGCYISKTTYLRMGENSFQDQFYRPVQLVEYYRYLRFMPDGKVLMMTNADEPIVGVTKLKNLQNLRPEVLHGYYRLFGSTVTLVLQKLQNQKTNVSGSTQFARHRKANVALGEANSTKYIIEFRIASSKKRKFVQLIWQHYSVQLTRNKTESSTNFDLIPAKYPPLWFSAVQSYHMETEAPLA